MSVWEKIEKLLNEKQIVFIKTELGYDTDKLNALSDEEFDGLYDILCDIEVEETIKADKKNINLSERGELAESIVTVVGNKLYCIEEV